VRDNAFPGVPAGKDRSRADQVCELTCFYCRDTTVRLVLGRWWVAHHDGDDEA